MARRTIAVMLGASLAIAPAPLLAQTPAPATATPPETTVAPVTVTARRPSADQARSEACIEAMRDPQVRALLATGAFNRYSRTRPPRNPDYGAQPTVPLDAPLPEVNVEDGGTRAVDLKTGSPSGFGPDDQDARALTRAEAVAACAQEGRSRRPLGGNRVFDGARQSALFYSRLTGPTRIPGSRFSGPPSFGSFRAPQRTITKPDRTLPLAFALFDQGRYVLALDAFQTAHKALGDVDGGDEAALMIGKIYLHALGDRRDPVEAVKWLEWAANSYFDPRRDIQPFDPKRPDYTTAIGEASMILADLYLKGDGPIAKDPQAARKWLERAVQTGYVPASKDLGDLYYRGVDMPKDVKTAFRHYMDAAKHAYAPAAAMVAAMYRSGEAPGGVNPALAAAWNNEAAKFEDPQALYALATAYDRGEGVPADPERAIGFYKVSALSGHAPAMTAIGTYFYTGEQVPKDLEVARGWFEEAALGADPDGMFNLAAMMARGEGGEADPVRAWGWLKIADSLGHPQAGAAAIALEARFTPQDRALAANLSRPAEAPWNGLPGPDPESDIDATLVGVAPGGPPWWKVTNGQATVWVMGLPAGLSPEKQGWNPEPLRQALTGARMMLTSYSPWGQIKAEKRPGAPLPPALAARLGAAGSKKPTFADAIALHWSHVRKSQLIDQASISVIRIPFNRKVAIARPPLQSAVLPSSLDPAGAGVAACVEAIVAESREPVAASRAAGEAWARGDVTGALSAPRGAEWSCRVLWPDHWQRSVGFLTEAIDMALDMPGKVVAAIDIGQLVATDGVLPRLRERGYEVSGPMQPTEP
jgi:TPR repeat protein